MKTLRALVTYALFAVWLFGYGCVCLVKGVWQIVQQEAHRA